MDIRMTWTAKGDQVFVGVIDFLHISVVHNQSIDTSTIPAFVAVPVSTPNAVNNQTRKAA